MKNSADNAYLNRRSNPRVDFRRSVRFQPEPNRPSRKLEQGVSQDMSLRGMQLLSPVMIDKNKPFDLWIPIDGHDVVRAQARAEWVEIESSLGDSPYWLRAGLSIRILSSEDRQRLATAIAGRRNDGSSLSDSSPKVGFVF